MIQEAVTNVIKHAATDRCRVTVSYARTRWTWRSPTAVPARPRARPGRGPAAGHGLTGMRERVGMYGGEFSAAPLPERRFPGQPPGSR